MTLRQTSDRDVIQLDFPHIPGTHCSSSSIADVLRFDGVALSEAMVFGLGSGLGFIYSDDPRYSPVHRFNGRALDLEGKFYALFGKALAWVGAWKPQALEQALAAGRPVLAQTDIAYLPYYDGVHFPLHGIVITGWDGAHAQVADTFSGELQRVAEADLRAALVGEGSPFMVPFHYAAAPRIAARVDRSVLVRAIELAAVEMLHPSVDGTGIPAMRRLVAQRRAWREAPDWAWSARFAYQGIEKRGTGGGGFRALYAQFLDEASEALPELAGVEAVARMREAAARWSAMAAELKSAFVGEDAAGIDRAAAVLEEIADHETALMADLRSAVNGNPRFER